MRDPNKSVQKAQKVHDNTHVRCISNSVYVLVGVDLLSVVTAHFYRVAQPDKLENKYGY